jgi:DNA-binding SARP family transcriptional activator
MSSLPSCIFGGFPITRSSKSFLAYLLLCKQQTHPRKMLADFFWTDHSNEGARSCLRTARKRLRLDCLSDEERRGKSELFIFPIALC